MSSTPVIYICIGVAGPVSGLRHGGPRHSYSSAENLLRPVWIGVAVVPVTSCMSEPRSSTSSSTLIVCGVYHRGQSLAQSCSCYTPLILLHRSRVTVSVRRPTIHRLMDRVGRVRHWNTIISCVDDVASWMRSNRLQLNTAKTSVSPKTWDSR